MTGPIGYRRQRVQDTREKLLKTTRTSLRTKGYASTNLADVAAGAGIAQRSIYRYFASKDDLVWAAVGTGDVGIPCAGQCAHPRCCLKDEKLMRSLLAKHTVGFLGLCVSRLTGDDPAKLAAATTFITNLTKETP